MYLYLNDARLLCCICLESGGKRMLVNHQSDSAKVLEIPVGEGVSDISVGSTIQGFHSFSWQRALKKLCCSVCMKTFFTVPGLRRHVTFKHVSRKIRSVAVPKEWIWSMSTRPFSRFHFCIRCVYCRELFASRKCLQTHQTCCMKLSTSPDRLRNKVINFLLFWMCR